MKKYIRSIKSEPTNNNNLLYQELVKIRNDELKNKRANNSRSKTRRANSKKRLYQSRVKRLEQYSKRLETDLPKSEQWFREKYTREVINRLRKEDYYLDQFNKPFNTTYIPDVHNKGYRYVIEIDGSWHDKPGEQVRDTKKDYYFNKRGYVVIRIKAYDEESYKAGIELVKARIIEIDKK